MANEQGHRSCARLLVPRRVVPRAYFHTSHFGSFLAGSYLDLFESYRALHKAKVLLIDFDNTLWEGVMADGAVRQRHDLQRLLRQLKEAGFLLVAVSKNDPANIRWQEMTLRPDDFVLCKINWQPKVQSIREAAGQLSLGLNTFILLDDNPVERDLVQTQLKEVGTLDPEDPRTLPWLERLLRFPNARQTEEARTRTELYRQQAARQAALDETLDYAGMMASLRLEAHFRRADRGDLDRIGELVQRTNQFNTTTIRYRKPELEELLRSEQHALYATSLADKFGAVGLVGVVVVRRDGSDRIVESFVMSCRAMGFELERLMLRRLLDAEEPGAARFVGRFVPSDRNTPAQDLFAASGFRRLSETEWEMNATDPRPDLPAWFTMPE